MPRKPGLTHDSYFKRHFSRIELANSFFQNYLPAEIQKRIRWDTIREFTEFRQTEQTEEYIMTLIETWQQRGYEKGINVGIEQGIEKGMKTKSIDLISKLLKQKFSTEASDWIEKLPTLNLDQLETVTERILFSDSLSEIFDGLIH